MVSAIPVPAAVKVSSHADIDYVPFRRRESYITCKDDDLTRVLGRGGAIYEMDCEDEEWLKKFNTEKGSEEPISADFFDMIISSFEKRLFCDEGNRLDVKAAVDHCIAAEHKKNEKKVSLEADAALTKLDDLDLGKGKRAQLLMEVADKCTYKATMALRVFEAIGQGKSLVDIAKNLID
ncbi:hypothetical protein ACET3Z_006372 [Daucus carota]